MNAFYVNLNVWICWLGLLGASIGYAQESNYTHQPITVRPANGKTIYLGVPKPRTKSNNLLFGAANTRYATYIPNQLGEPVQIQSIEIYFKGHDGTPFWVELRSKTDTARAPLPSDAILSPCTTYSPRLGQGWYTIHFPHPITIPKEGFWCIVRSEKDVVYPVRKGLRGADNGVLVSSRMKGGYTCVKFEEKAAYQPPFPTYLTWAIRCKLQ